MYTKRNHGSRPTSNQAGFTLIELLIVIIIICILSTLLIPALSNYVHSARMSRTAREVTNVGHSWMAYAARQKVDIPFFATGETFDPSTISVDITPGELENLFETPIPAFDAFGNPYIYRVDDVDNPRRFFMASTTDGTEDGQEFAMGTRITLEERALDQIYADGCPAQIADGALAENFVPQGSIYYPGT